MFAHHKVVLDAIVKELERKVSPSGVQGRVSASAVCSAEHWVRTAQRSEAVVSRNHVKAFEESSLGNHRIPTVDALPYSLRKQESCFTSVSRGSSVLCVHKTTSLPGNGSASVCVSSSLLSSACHLHVSVSGFPVPLDGP